MPFDLTARINRPWSRYLIAIIAVAAAAAVRAQFLGSLGPRTPYLTFFPAVTIVALLAGLPAGLLATALSAAYLVSSLDPAVHSLILQNDVDRLGMAIFVTSCVLICFVAKRLHSARKRAADAESRAKLAEQQRLNEAKLLDSEARHRFLFENSLDAVFLTTWDGDIIAANRASCQLFGMTEDELRRAGRTGLLDHSDPRVADYLKGRAEQGSIRSEIFQLRKDGSRFPAEISAVVMDGEKSSFVILRDITERKQAEAALRESKQQYENLVSRISVGVYILRSVPDGAFALDYVSPRMAEILEVSVARLLEDAHSFFGKIHPDDLDSFDTLNREGIKNLQPFDWEGRFLVEGGIKWLQFKSSPEPLESGDVLWHGVVSDTTKIKLAEEAVLALNAGLEQRVRERTAELEAAVREQESFSYSVSHDLRAPLRHINGFSAILAEDYGSSLPPKALNYLQRIEGATSRMGAMIDHLLELSRVSRIELERNSVDLSELAAEVAVMLQETEPQRCVEFSIEKGLSVRGDRKLLGQLLENLIGNAWKYSSGKPSALIEFGSISEGGQETFFVRDDGVGFDMAYSGKLFEVFQRLHGEEFEGTGIGLATAHRIVQRHGGTIWAHGQINQGATFYFALAQPAAGKK